MSLFILSKHGQKSCNFLNVHVCEGGEREVGVGDADIVNSPVSPFFHDFIARRCPLTVHIITF